MHLPHAWLSRMPGGTQIWARLQEIAGPKEKLHLRVRIQLLTPARTQDYETQNGNNC